MKPKIFLEKIFSKFRKQSLIVDKEHEYFRTLDELPLSHWIKIYQEKDYKYLIKDIDYRIFTINEKINLEAEKIWENIYDEYIDNFGFTKKYKRVLELERKIALLTCKMLIEDNPFINNELKIKKQQLDKEKNNNTIDEKGNDFTRQIVLIEKWLNSSIEINTISTRKYFTYLNLITEEADMIKQKQAKENG